MNLKPETKEYWWYVSDEKMMLNHEVWGRTTLNTQGVHDSIEQTYQAYVAYGYEPFIDGIKSCWKRKEYKNALLRLIYGYYYKPQRYPIEYEGMRGMSRDHVIYSIMAFIHSGMNKVELWEYIKRIPFNIGDNIGTLMTPKLWLWGRLVSGKLIGQLYYPMVAWSAFKNYHTNKMVESVLGFGMGVEEHQTQFKPLFRQEKPKIIKTLTGLYYPTYANKLTANMLKVVPQNWFTKIAKKYSLKMVPTYNYAQKILLGGKLSEEEIADLSTYEPMTGDRWSDQLNKWYSDRPLYIIKNRYPDKNYTDGNCLDKDYALKLLEKQKNDTTNTKENC